MKLASSSLAVALLAISAGEIGSQQIELATEPVPAMPDAFASRAQSGFSTPTAAWLVRMFLLAMRAGTPQAAWALAWAKAMWEIMTDMKYPPPETLSYNSFSSGSYSGGGGYSGGYSGGFSGGYSGGFSGGGGGGGGSPYYG
jgi:uncharacterized membrane protein YgcG